MIEWINENSLIVGLLSGSVGTFLLGLLASYLRRDKRWLGYSVASRNIVETDQPELHITYRNEPIERLDSHQVLIRNTGNRALIDLPVRVNGAQGSTITGVDLQQPDGAQYATEVDKNQLSVTCDLLNPGEAFTIGITVADSTDGKISVAARAENLYVREISERSTSAELLEALLEASPISGIAVDIARILSRAIR